MSRKLNTTLEQTFLGFTPTQYSMAVSETSTLVQNLHTFKQVQELASNHEPFRLDIVQSACKNLRAQLSCDTRSCWEKSLSKRLARLLTQKYDTDSMSKGQIYTFARTRFESAVDNAFDTFSGNKRARIEGIRQSEIWKQRGYLDRNRGVKRVFHECLEINGRREPLCHTQVNS